jgi:hypothetical protein
MSYPSFSENLIEKDLSVPELERFVCDRPFKKIENAQYLEKYHMTAHPMKCLYERWQKYT